MPVPSVPGLVFEVDATGALIAINDEWTRLTGQPVGDALGTGWLSLTHPEDAQVWMSLLRDRSRAPIADTTADVRIRKVDGEWASLRVWFRPRRVDGRVVSYCGLGALSVGSPELEQLEARTDALLAALPDAMLQLSAEGVVLKARPGAEGIVSIQQFLGRALHEALPASVSERAWAAIHRARETNAQQRFEYQDLRGRELEVRVMPMRTGEFLFLLRDVTEQKHAEAELVAAREQALEGSRHKTQFLANVSHEIRTPLNGILGVTQLLRTWALPREAGEYLDVLQTSGESLLGIVNAVLDLSKIEANRLELELATIDVEKVVASAARAFVPLAQKRGVGLDIIISPEAQGPVRGDATRVRQVVNNLVGNAVKFTERGRVTVRLRRLEPGSELMALEVEDTGPGIAPDVHEYIFEPFVQAEGTQRRFGGTGLGLSITRRLARLMGGDVRLISTVGVGTTFTATLALPAVLLEREAKPNPRRASPEPRSLTVLLAEDNAVNAAMTSALILRLGHRVEVVPNGQAAVEAVGQGKFDLVIMDVQMPIVDGLQATRAIRDSERSSGRHIPIVALTANAMKGDDLLCLSAGMDAYLPKPVAVEALKDVLTWFGTTG